MVGERTHQVAWYLESECEGMSSVRSYVDALKEFINVDIYGPCGDMICSPKAQVMFNFYINVTEEPPDSQ